jgi:hypothetical protein
LEETREQGTYEEHFGFKGTPFGRGIPVTELMKSGQWNELTGRMKHVAHNREFGLFTGPKIPAFFITTPVNRVIQCICRFLRVKCSYKNYNYILRFKSHNHLLLLTC